jgi:radical SAM-linked protein
MEVFIDNSDRPILLVLKFKVSGTLRFLSHAETLRMFQRACARAALDTVYSLGFNPRMKISLPLPRTVGLACDDEICCLPLNRTGPLEVQILKEKLSTQMPDGIELFDAQLADKDVSFQNGTAVYVFVVKLADAKNLNEKAVQILASDSLVLTRTSGKNTRPKTIDVRNFIESIKIAGHRVTVSAGFGPNGSVRIEEMLALLGLEIKNLAGPVTRTKVLWNDMANARN